MTQQAWPGGPPIGALYQMERQALQQAQMQAMTPEQQASWVADHIGNSARPVNPRRTAQQRVRARVAALIESGSPFLQSRQIIDREERGWLFKSLHTVAEIPLLPAWPIGSFWWEQPESNMQLGMTRRPTGLTRELDVVPMDGPGPADRRLSAELKQRIPAWVRLAGKDPQHRSLQTPDWSAIDDAMAKYQPLQDDGDLKGEPDEAPAGSPFLADWLLSIDDE
jgi:hypothetical protein